MRQNIFGVLTFLLALSAFTPGALAISDEESKKMFTEFVHAYYESDATTFLKICKKFDKPMFTKLKDVQNWMDKRLAVQETYLKVMGVIVTGQAQITSEIVGDITFRFDGTEKSPSRVVVVTAFLDRVITFDEKVVPARRVVDQVAILKIYATIVEEKYLSFKSDEINFGYEFASPGGKAASR